MEENVNYSDPLITVFATDKDKGNYGDVRYYIEEDDKYFRVENTSVIFYRHFVPFA